MKVGLTGGIGCGKSTVVGFFQKAGWNTVESDAVVRELLSTNTEVRQAILNRWGDRVLSGSELSRRAIAAIVFADATELTWLEERLHPLVREHWQSQLDADPAANGLVEIPLLFEKSLETAFDLTVCVISSPDVVEARMAARGYTGAEVERRRSRQMPLSEKMRLADYVISNSGSLEFLEKQIERLILQITNPTS